MTVDKTGVDETGVDKLGIKSPKFSLSTRVQNRIILSPTSTATHSHHASNGTSLMSMGYRI